MLAVRHPAPNFQATAVISGAFQEVSLDTYTSQGKWVILLFYPLDFTFVCPTEILAFNDSLSEFEDLNAVVLGISTDSEYSHLAWSLQPRKQGGLGPDLKLPLVADKPMKISRDYGVLIEEDGKALRGLFIIDPKGTLRQQTVNDLPVGRSVDETLRLIKAFQFADKHGEVCPANWKEGGKTMKADPKASLQYFEYIASNGTAETNGKKRPGDEAQVDGAKKAKV